MALIWRSLAYSTVHDGEASEKGLEYVDKAKKCMTKVIKSEIRCDK